MFRIGHRRFRALGGLALALWSGAALACNVPVFRYALERWEADPYHVVVFHRAPLTTDQETQISALEHGPSNLRANLVVDRIDLTRDLPTAERRLWDAQDHPPLPWVAVRYPKPTGIDRSAWTGSLEPGAMRLLVDSPARRTIVEKLLSGDAIIWLLLEGIDPRRNAEIGHRLETTLRQLERTLILPERTAADPPINPDLPLKIAFSTVRVVRSDPAERLLVNLLLNWNTNLIVAQEPMLFPIFGRGRVIPPAIGEQIQAEAIRDMAEFLTGPCSCEVKEMNPGYDLLLAANWSALPDYQETSVPPLPPLVGLSQFATAATTNSPAPPHPENPTPTRTGPSTGLMRNTLVVLGVGAVFLALATLILKTKAGRGPR